MINGFIKITAFGLIFLFSTSFTTTAQAEGRLTDEIIRNFIQETTDITASQDHGFDSEYIREYLERHLHKQSRFKSTVKYSIPGHDAQKNSLSLNKEDYIDSVLKAPKTLGEYDQEVEILNIRIAKDGGNATVTTKSKESGSLNVSADQQVPMEGISTCNQIIVMDKSNVIQMYSAQCTTEVEFTGFP